MPSDAPWIYPYVEDPHSSGIYHPDNIVLRPVLEIELLGPAVLPDEDPPRVAALVDSGAERTFAAPWLARAIGADLHYTPEIRVGRQRGFFDRFTVTLNRYAQAIAIEPVETFDARFGT